MRELPRAQQISNIIFTDKPLPRAKYSGEARYGENVDIAIREEDNLVFLNGTKDSKKVFKVRIEY